MKQKQIKLNPESGRSMIEMLGILAVIGVLSITAIAGYSYAMRQNRVNELTNQLKTTGYYCLQQYGLFGLTDDCDISTYKTDYGYATFSNAFAKTATGLLQGSLTGLDKDLCDAMKNRLEDWSETGVDATSTCAAETNNTLTFTYNVGLKSVGVVGGGNGENEETEETPEVNCMQKEGTNECIPCDTSGGVSGVSVDACHSCSGNNIRFMATNGVCYSCADTSSLSTGITEQGQEECHRCNVGIHKRWLSVAGTCYSCAQTGGLLNPLNSTECDICKDTENPNYMNGAYCMDCPNNLSSLNTEEKCTSCNGTWNGTSCSK